MHTPNNEGKACDAVVRFLERFTSETRRDIRHPEKDNTVPKERRVDLHLKLGAQEYAIEHTRIGPLENEIRNNFRFVKRYNYIKERILDSLPGLAYYILEIPVDFKLPANRKQREREIDELIEWIQLSAHYMQELIAYRIKQTGGHDRTALSLKVTQLKFGCDIELLRVPYATFTNRKPGSIEIRPIYPDDIEMKARRIERLQQAFDDKCPKLKHCKEGDDADTRTVLILESVELALRRDAHIGYQLHALLTERSDAPDEIYLVETGMSYWLVFPVKRDVVHWPAHMPEFPLFIYDEDKSPTAGMPKWYRDALGLNDLYTTFPRGWSPASYEAKELNDLTPGCNTRSL